MHADDDESDYIMAPKLDCENEDSFHLKDINRINLDINQSGSGSPSGEMPIQDQGKILKEYQFDFCCTQFLFYLIF